MGHLPVLLRACRLAVCALAISSGAVVSTASSSGRKPDSTVAGSRTLTVRTFEDIYGPSGDSFQAALGFRVFEGDSYAPAQTGYGVGVDDMLVQWREYRLIEDATDCATGGACASVVIDSARTYGGEGVLVLRILDASPYGMTPPFDHNDCDGNRSYTDPGDDTDCDNDGIADVVAVVTSLGEPGGEKIVANLAAPGMYTATLPFSAAVNVPGVLYVQADGPGHAVATVRYEDRWDGSAAGNRCLNAPDPAAQGFVTEPVEIVLVTGTVAVISSRLVEVSGDGDGYPDTNETFDLFVTVANKTTVPLTNVVVRISSSDPKIDCILTAAAVIPSLDPKGGANANRETPTAFRLHVAPTADRGGTVPPASCTGGICSNGAGACASAVNCQKGVTDDYSAAIQVAVSADQFDVNVNTGAPLTYLDLDLNSAATVLTTSTFVEGFESGLGNFTLMNLDANLASNSLSNGARCQYNDPDYVGSNSYGDSECYLGFAGGQVPINDWHNHTTASPDGGRAYLGTRSLHYGKHTAGSPNLDTYGLSQMDAVGTSAVLNLAPRICANDPAPDKRACNTAADCVVVGGGPCASASPSFSFKHQISLADSRCTSTDGALDRAVIAVQTAGSGKWQKLYPYENTYDERGTAWYDRSCRFDPTDDGNTEDDFFDPTDPNRLYGPSSTCFPEFVFAYLGDTEAPYAPTRIGRASDGPGLQGSLGIGTWVESKVDLSRFRGQSIRLRFLITSIKVGNVLTWEIFGMWNPQACDDGWYLDDVRVTQTLGTSAPLAFLDSADNSLRPSCPATPCSLLTPTLAVSPSSGSTPGSPVTLSALASTADRCTGGVLLYRFFIDADGSGSFSLGDVELRPFGPAPTLAEAPVATTRFGVTVRCSSSATGACAGADAVATYSLACSPPPAVYDPALWWAQTGFGGKQTLRLPPFGEITDLIRGDLGTLRSTGTFTGSSPVCLHDNLGGTSFVDASTPPAGTGYYYLFRGQTTCNDSTSYSTYSPTENPNDPGKRDAELTACPP